VCLGEPSGVLHTSVSREGRWPYISISVMNWMSVEEKVLQVFQSGYKSAICVLEPGESFAGCHIRVRLL
jgi:hypothetical protein